eukprot:TRINITY_DN10159_c0_g10_i1.p2 TRINITY_DN10159_c0_g10~~TRINITY_DN10159_c0_g10_i1.p2  ORF type:complete len:106 (-),score=7.54 TRINITY_DN10159_c0_g10_i1:1592-1909(-)
MTEANIINITSFLLGLKCDPNDEAGTSDGGGMAVAKDPYSLPARRRFTHGRSALRRMMWRHGGKEGGSTAKGSPYHAPLEGKETCWAQHGGRAQPRRRKQEIMDG